MYEKLQTKRNQEMQASHRQGAMEARSPQLTKSIGNQAMIRLMGMDEEEKKPNATGIPDQMKQGLEERFRLSLDDVRVHYHSDRPARLNAWAYTQGSQVYVGPGQEKHLGHELGHVVQQKQGRVHATAYAAGLAVNDDEGLEKEADAIGQPLS